MIGAYVSQAPQNFEILQKELPMFLAGTKEGGQVYAKLLCEKTGRTAIDWKKAQQSGNQWSVEFKKVPPGLYTIATCLRESDEDLELARQGDKRFHVGVGDVFVIAGQSNAVGFGREAYDDPPMLGVHLLRNSGHWDLAAHPLGDSTGSLKVNRDKKNPGHSPYLCFAKLLCGALGYPVGLVQTALGGSGMALWNPDETGTLYQNMLCCAKKCGRIKGVLWYQGESEAISNNTDGYADRFLNMVSRLRADLNQPDLPFITCGLNHYDRDIGSNDKSWETMRHVQETLSKTQPHILFVPTVGLPTTDGIHNSVSANKIIGRRLFEAVYQKLYQAEE